MVLNGNMKLSKAKLIIEIKNGIEDTKLSSSSF